MEHFAVFQKICWRTHEPRILRAAYMTKLLPCLHLMVPLFFHDMFSQNSMDFLNLSL